VALHSDWLPLNDAVDRLAARDVRADRAKLDICTAITDLRLRIRVHVNDDTAPKIFETNDIQISDRLNPAHLNWAGSRPALLYPWKIRSGDGWRVRPVTLIEACAGDFTTELCKDVSSVQLPSRESILVHSVSYSNRLRGARELAETDWTPCHGTVDVLGRLADYEAKTISVDQALSIMAFGSFVDPPERDEVEVVAFKQQAASALCHAALMDDVTMCGSHLSADGKVQPIFEVAFGSLRWVGDVPNSLVRDHESSAPSYKGEQSWDGDWFNVEVDVASLVGWLQTSVEAARRKQMSRKLSRRLFECPLWSIETALCWIAIRDASLLKENLLWHRRRRHPDKNVESQPEIRLLRALKDGMLKAQNEGRVLPGSYWANSVATVGDVSAATPSLRVAREDVLRIFPETLTPSYRGVRARRQASIDRFVQRMQATRQWMGCAEIADWSTRYLAKPASGRSAIFDKLEKSFVLRRFLLGRRSQLCLLRADTTVIRLICAPVDRTVDAEGLRPVSVLVSRRTAAH
jgi:hypothetical protein